MSERVVTNADQAIRECLNDQRSFALIAGAGSGKTTSLIKALDEIRTSSGASLRQNGQHIACITFTNRAVDVIRQRLGFDDLYRVSTLHSFLWGEVRRFQQDIRDVLKNDRLPSLISAAEEQDNGRKTNSARKARAKVARLKKELAGLTDVPSFRYDDAAFSDYPNGKLSHDDIVEIASYLLAERESFRRLIGMRYPFVFVDEAQDTFPRVVDGLNQVCAGSGLPLVGYFGDPWQQIYDGRADDFAPPDGGTTITKTENFRCSPEVIDFLNKFRTDIQQVAAGSNATQEGSVEICLIEAESPEGARKRYSEAQLDRALNTMDHALDNWGWNDRDDVVRLFLVRQMIARRLHFENLQKLFTGQFASQRAQKDFESGEHYLIKPFITTICPLVEAYRTDKSREVINILRTTSPAYNPYGPNAKRKLSEMINESQANLKDLVNQWEKSTIRDVLHYCLMHQLISGSERLGEQLARSPRQDVFDDEADSEEKGDWLADNFFGMSTKELLSYRGFIMANTPYSTQHGVKGEEYPNVLVVFDDVEAAWNSYSFTKLLTPITHGDPTERQFELGKKLAYVCFSRAMQHLRILLFTSNPNAAKKELIEKRLFNESQISLSRASS